MGTLEPFHRGEQLGAGKLNDYRDAILRGRVSVGRFLRVSRGPGGTLLDLDMLALVQAFPGKPFLARITDSTAFAGGTRWKYGFNAVAISPSDWSIVDLDSPAGTVLLNHAINIAEAAGTGETPIPTGQLVAMRSGLSVSGAAFYWFYAVPPFDPTTIQVSDGLMWDGDTLVIDPDWPGWWYIVQGNL